jgi:hypothetical protein
MDADSPRLTMDVLPGRYAIARLDGTDPVPSWALEAEDLGAVVRRRDELSIVCHQGRVPAGVMAQRDYAAVVVRGPVDFALTGILAALAAPLAEAGVPIFAVSTYDTDVLLLPAAQLAAARGALERAGHTLVDPPAVSRSS